HVRVDQPGQEASAVLEEQVTGLLHLGAADRGDPAVGDAQMGGGQGVAIVDEAGSVDGDRCCVHAGNAEGSRGVRVQRTVTGWIIRSGMWPDWLVSPRALCAIMTTSVCWRRAMWPATATAGTGAGSCCGCNAFSYCAGCAFRWTRCSRCSMARPMSAQRWPGTARNCWPNGRNWTGSWRPWTAPWRL